MYTQCPDCSTAFRVTANDLKQAAGKVRCGGCGSAFDALEFLTEDTPEQPPAKESPRQLPELQPDRPAGELPEKISPEESIALLKTLDELAGSDIRLEDTGIEWRVLDDQVIAELETADALDEETDSTIDDDGETDDEPQPDEPRYDDDTPLPEDAEEQDASEAIDEDAPEDETPAEELPTDEAPDEESESQSDEVDVDFDEDEADDWEEILDEVDTPDEEEQADDAGEDEPSEPVDDDAAESGESSDVEEEVDDEEDAGREEAADQDEAADHDEDSERDEDAEHDEEADLDEEEDSDSEARDDEDDDEDEHLPDVQEEEVEVESIIMEGETVRNALDELAEGAQAAEVDMSHWVRPEEDVAPDQFDTRKSGTALGVVLLLLVLSLQVVHYYRETLATVPAIQGIIAPVYRAIGMPLAPDWDVTGWRFEATQGSTDGNNDELTVNSRIGNTSDESLPYPLVGISLTDRFDNTVGSRLLEPHDYLTEGANPRKLVEAGATFDAIISIKSPDTLATGYKLNVCYRSSSGTSVGQLRCAIGDFKE